MFRGLRFKCLFYQIFIDFRCHLGFHLAPIFIKKAFRKSLKKKRPPYLKNDHYRRVRWLPGTPPRVRITQTRNNSSSSKSSNSCPWLWFRKIARKWLFELASVATASKQIRKNGKGRCQKHMARDLTRPGQRPGEFRVPPRDNFRFRS